jgi:hypothetical protein
MKDVNRMFRERVQEIDLYFDFLEKRINKGDQTRVFDDNSQDLDRKLNQILRANSFLLLYNLVESSVSQAIEAIHLEISDKGISYDSLNQSVKREIFSHLKKRTTPDQFVAQIENIITDILKFYPQSREIFSGNVDAKEIRQLASKYGFSHDTNSDSTKDGIKLRIVKERRNDLAHGFISFQECGKDYTIEDVIETKNEVIDYIKTVLLNIENYLSTEQYKTP